MVLFIDIVRKFSFKYFTQYLHEIAKAVIKEFTDNLPEAVDDDLRGLGALSIDRIASADNLTVGDLITKAQLCKTIYEGGQNELALWLYMNDVNSPNQYDRSGWTGYTERSLLMDGVNDGINCGNDATLWSQSLTKFSFSFWIYPTAINDGNTRRIVHHAATLAQSFNCFINSSGAGGEIVFEVRSAANVAFQAISTALLLHRWNFVTCVYDNSLGSQNIKIYVNGVLGAQTANLTEAINASATLFIGDSGNRFKGKFKDFRWWTTTPLTLANVQGLQKLSPKPSPNYWLKCNEMTGDPVDAISAANTAITTKVGTLTNGTLWNLKDYTKEISRIGNPCVVKTTQSFIGRQELGYFDGVGDGLVVTDHEDLRIAKNLAGFSIGYWLYVPTGADAVKPALIVKNSIALDGANDYIDCTNDATLWSQSLTKFSFTFWIYPTSAWTGTARFILLHGSGAQNFQCHLDASVSGRIVFRIRNAAGSSIDARNDNIQLNQWNHVACVYDNSLGSGNLKIYVNAVVGTNANLTEAINQSATLRVGGDGSNGLQGNIKDFHWWTTTPLTAGQVDARYRGFIWDENNFANYYLPMWEGTGNPTDLQTGTKVGTLTNGAAWDTIIYPPYIESFPATIYKKEDNGSDGIMIFLDPTSKRLVIHSRHSNQKLKRIDNAYAYNTWTFHVVEYTPTGDVFAFYKDGVSQTIVDADTAVNYDPAVNDAYIANTGLLFADPTGAVYANVALYNFKFWQRILTSTEIGRENTNKFSISNVQIAELPIVGFSTIAHDTSQGCYLPGAYLYQCYETG